MTTMIYNVSHIGSKRLSLRRVSSDPFLRSVALVPAQNLHHTRDQIFQRLIVAILKGYYVPPLRVAAMADQGVVDDPNVAADRTLIDGLQRTTCYIIGEGDRSQSWRGLVLRAQNLIVDVQGYMQKNPQVMTTGEKESFLDEESSVTRRLFWVKERLLTCPLRPLYHGLLEAKDEPSDTRPQSMPPEGVS